MDLLATRKLILLTIPEITLLVGCASNAKPAVDAPSAPISFYQLLLAESKQYTDAGLFLAHTIHIDDESKDGLMHAVDEDAIARASILAECGSIDVVSCFSGSPRTETKIRSPQGEQFQMSCIRFSGEAKNGGFLVANVYLVQRSESSGWKFIASNKHYFDDVMGMAAVDSCWADQEKR